MSKPLSLIFCPVLGYGAVVYNLLSEPIMLLISSMQTLVIDLIAPPRYSRGLKLAGVFANDLRIAAVVARRRSLSTLILQMFIFVARLNCSGAMPRAFGISPPYSFMV